MVKGLSAAAVFIGVYVGACAVLVEIREALGLEIVWAITVLVAFALRILRPAVHGRAATDGGSRAGRAGVDPARPEAHGADGEGGVMLRLLLQGCCLAVALAGVLVIAMAVAYPGDGICAVTENWLLRLIYLCPPLESGAN